METEYEFKLFDSDTQLSKFIDDVMWDRGRREFCEDVGKIKSDLTDIEDKQHEINGIFDEIDGLLDQYRCSLDKQKKELEEVKTVDDESVYTYNYVSSSHGNSIDTKMGGAAEEKKEEDIYKYHSFDNHGIKKQTVDDKSVVSLETNKDSEMEVIDLSIGDDHSDPEKPQTPGRQEQSRGKPPLAGGMKLLGRRRSDEVWYEGTFLEVIKDQKGQEKYKIKYDKNGGKSLLSGKHIAYATHPRAADIRVGSRIVGIYLNEADTHDECLYAGIVAEVPLPANNYRYLIFFDDGFAQYMGLNKLYSVYQQSNNVWEDIHPDSREFIKEYMELYPERPMVKVKPGQWIRTEWNGEWWRAKVLEVDGSLVNMLFEVDQRSEWVYRGSPRLETLFTELQQAEKARSSDKGIAHVRSRSHAVKSKGPYVEYTRVTDLTIDLSATPPPPQTQSTKDKKLKQTARKSTSFAAPKQVARKSTTSYKPLNYDEKDPLGGNTQWKAPWLTPKIVPRSNTTKGVVQQTQQKMDIASVLQSRLQLQQDNNDSSQHTPQVSDFSYLYAQQQYKKVEMRKRFIPHSCAPQCVASSTPDPARLHGQNPYLKPELCGWRKELGKQRGSGKRSVFYRTPCGRSLRDIKEVDRYLLETEIQYLTIDMFTFDQFVHTHTHIRNPKPVVMINDISEGQEPIPVSCVNEIDTQYPRFAKYSSERICARGVSINTDEDFFITCDCTDGCRDKSKCACQQLTIQATLSTNKAGIIDPEAGYEYRSVYDQIPSGIYECNPRCKCNHTCFNRVAQHKLQCRLQVFKTEKRGWGLRCLDDIPFGAFVCTYAGEVLTEELANEDGKRYGDEYLAELDLIEVAENNKEGYESDVKDPDDITSSDSSDSSSGDDPPPPSSSISSDSESVSVVTSSAVTVASTDDEIEELSSSGKKVGKLLLRRQSSEKTEQWAIERPNKKSINNHDKKHLSAEKDKLENIEVKEDVYIFPKPNENTLPSSVDRKDGSCQSKVNIQIKKDSIETDSASDSDIKPPTGEVPDGLDIKDKKYLENSLTAFFEGNSGPSDVEKTPDAKKVNFKTNMPCKKSSSGGSNAAEEAMDTTETSVIEPMDTTSQKSTIPVKLSDSLEVVTKEKSTTMKGESNSECIDLTINDDDKGAKTPNSTHCETITEDIESTDIGEKKKENDQNKPKNNGSSNSGLLITGATSLAVDSDVETSDSETESEPKLPPKQIKEETEAEQKPVTPLKIRIHVPKDVNMQAPPPPSTPVEQESKEHSRTRSFFNNEKHCYVMDAKSIGNLGRYLNHSCSPNLFVQNVFVDTHDLRFPWVAFFAQQYIRAGSELTWDYNYEVGSVPGKVLQCYCGSTDCRGRLL
ncbi:histone-lysine N-methyltransferase SETDB1-like [Saccoglossus kowalevskii]